MLYIVDTYAWIEYFSGSKQGSILKKLFEDQKNKFITMECCIAELVGYSLKNNIDFRKIHTIVKTNSVILPVLTDHWIEAAKTRYELRKKIDAFGMIDAILVAKQKELKCKIISGDSHFKKLNNIEYIGE
jgi:predicted nucleic acid-binding protein